jgi:hypothetical protein
MSRTSHTGLGGNSRWVAAVIAIFGAGLTAFAFYPGFMNIDSLNQYEISKSGVYHDWHPPVMSWVWAGLNSVFDGPQGMLYLQVVLLWGGLFFWFVSFAGSRWRWAFLCLGVMPWVINLAGVLWKDVGVAFALGAAMALGMSRPTGPRIVVCLGLLFYGLALRHNAVVALPPLIWFLCSQWCPLLARWKRVLCIAGVMVSLVGSVSLLNYGVLHAQKTYPFTYIAIDDLSYLSLHGGRSLFPTVSLEQIRECAVQEIGENKLVGRSFCLHQRVKGELLDKPQVAALWRKAVLEQPGPYLRYRLAAFVYLLRSPADAPYFVWYPGLDTNSLGLQHNDNIATKVVRGWVVNTANVLPFAFKPYWWLIVAAVFTAWGIMCRPGAHRQCLLALSISAVAYLFGYLLATPMADLRYSYWTI